MSTHSKEWQAELGRLVKDQAIYATDAARHLVRDSLTEAIASAQRWDEATGKITAHLAEARWTQPSSSRAIGELRDPEARLNPECRAGKHGNCDGSAMCEDRDCDAIHECDCNCHEETPTSQEETQQ